ncbi:MAG: carbohydrate-binding domain-containing protein, partial [Eubacteriales bacterium]
MKKIRLLGLLLAFSILILSTAAYAIDFSDFLNKWSIVEEAGEEEEEIIPEPVTVELGGFIVTGFEDYFSYEYGVLNIMGDEEGNEIIVKNIDPDNATSDCISMEGGAKVVLEGVNISASNRNPILVGSNDDNTITLAEDTINVLTVTAGSYATVGVKAGNRVVFQGTGQLIVNNFGSGACIGGSGNSGQTSGSITIEDGTYRLNPTTGAGIGGGYYGDGGEITINDGDITVTAPSETYSAGIGGGAYGTGGIITIGGGS